MTHPGYPFPLYLWLGRTGPWYGQAYFDRWLL